MKRRSLFVPLAFAIGCSAVLVTAMSAVAASPAQTTAKTAKKEAAPRSVFVNPSSPKEGRDPFFPTSTRPYENAQVNQQPHIGDLSSLVLKGVSGPAGSRLAIINNHTFGVGDEQDLVTPQGRIRVRCIEIKDDSVVVESGGQRQELKYANP